MGKLVVGSLAGRLVLFGLTVVDNLVGMLELFVGFVGS